MAEYEENSLFSKSINPNFVCPKAQRLLFVDDLKIENVDAFIFEINSEYNKPFYSANSVVHFKLKINLIEYVLLQNSLFPRLGFTE
jgi:hypothetical protein